MLKDRREFPIRDDGTEIIARVWMKKRNENFLGEGTVELLCLIDEYGSITKAAKAMKISYKTAWDTINRINNLASEPLVESASGGAGGGGTVLTEKGRRMIEIYRVIEHEHRRFIENLRLRVEDFDESYQLMRRLFMKTSARNQFMGKVAMIKQGQVNVEVVMELKGGISITGVITHESLESLDLKVGDEAYALIKATWVIVSKEKEVKTSARNRLSGKIIKITEGKVSTEVTLELPGGNRLAAVITNESSSALGLAKGEEASVFFKASSVIIGVA